VASQGIYIVRANINIGPALLGMYNVGSIILFVCLFFMMTQLHPIRIGFGLITGQMVLALPYQQPGRPAGNS
jgi:hypothetical protein